MIRSAVFATVAGAALAAALPARAQQQPGFQQPFQQQPQFQPTPPPRTFIPSNVRGYQGGVGWGWFTANPPLQQCMTAASQAMQQQGLIVDEIGPGETGVVGGKDGDAVVIQCVPQRNIITLVWHGRNNYTTPLFDGMKAILGIPNRTPQAPRAPQNPGFSTPGPSSDEPVKRFQ